MSNYHVDDDLNKARVINDDLDWLVMNYFCEPVDNDDDWVITISLLIYQNW